MTHLSRTYHALITHLSRTTHIFRHLLYIYIVYIHFLMVFLGIKMRKNAFFIKKYARACIYEKKVVNLQPIWNGRNMKEILIAIIFLLVAMALLSVGVIFRKDHSFRSQHIHANERMKKDGIHCSTAQDREMRRAKKHKIDVGEL